VKNIPALVRAASIVVGSVRARISLRRSNPGDAVLELFESRCLSRLISSTLEDEQALTLIAGETGLHAAQVVNFAIEARCHEIDGVLKGAFYAHPLD